MSQKAEKTREQSFAEAALRLSQHVYASYPQAVISPLDVPYTDEDLTIEVLVPEQHVLSEVSDSLIRICLEIEYDLGVSILTQAGHISRKEHHVE
ncbi:MAG: hypothetical protein V3R80_14515 [Candidatus Tectomicrobia bacterium]